MKQTARIISTYSADAFGVCSALFELGGMTVMHDASGCNSTYTTHDEPRWYDMDSMVYISGLSEMEAIMGDDEKLIDDIIDAAESLHPAFVAICGTPIPMMTGFDYQAVAEVIETRTGIPCFGLPTSGMNTYVQGASMAWKAIAERLTDDVAQEEIARPLGIVMRSKDGNTPSMFEKIRVNILGLTPLDFSVNGQDKSICNWLTENNFEIISRWAMGSTLAEIRRSGKADVNLVVSAAGLEAAQVLYQKFGIPYVIGLPIGQDQKDMIKDAINELAFESRAVRHSENPGARAGTECIAITSDLLDASEQGQSADVILIGEGITNLALAGAIEFETGKTTKVLCATECPEWILRDHDLLTPDEDDIIPALKDAKVIIADPLYQPICQAEARFIALPAESFSGRIYRADIPDLIADPSTIIDRIEA